GGVDRQGPARNIDRRAAGIVRPPARRPDHPTLPNALWRSRRAGESAEAEREDQRLLRTMVSQALGRVLRGEGRRSRREPILPRPCLAAYCPQLKHRSRVTPRACAHRAWYTRTWRIG